MEASRQASLESKVVSLQQQLAAVQDGAERVKAEYSSLESHHRQVCHFAGSVCAALTAA